MIPALSVVDALQLRPRAFRVDELFAALRGMMRPLMIGDEVALNVLEPEESITLDTDEGKVSQILRNLISNAGTEYAVLDATGGSEGVRLARSERPALIVLDFMLGETSAFDVLDDLKLEPVTRTIPVIIQTSKTLEESERKRLAPETAAIFSKENLSREPAISRIREALLKAGVRVERPHAS